MAGPGLDWYEDSGVSGVKRKGADTVLLRTVTAPSGSSGSLSPPPPVRSDGV